MKKLMLGLILSIGLTGVSVSAWEPEDLTKYPSCMEAETKLINLGVGFGSEFYKYWKEDYIDIVIPPIRGTFDVNVPIGDKKLPFFIGGIFGYLGYGHNKDELVDEWFMHNFSFGLRFGYHFNWGIENLDTYAVGSLGWIVHASNDDTLYKVDPGPDDLLFHINVGARYFVINWFGFWAEAAFGTLFSVDVGIAFKF
jgi:hypothetical protein